MLRWLYLRVEQLPADSKDSFYLLSNEYVVLILVLLRKKDNLETESECGSLPVPANYYPLLNEFY